MLLCCHATHDDPTLLSRAMRLCPPARCQKAARLLPRQQAVSIAAGLLLRHGLLLRGIRDPALSVDASGRPFLEGNSVYFSLSHSGEYAACALSDTPVGVDIQQIVSISPRVIHRFCTEEEQRWLPMQPDPKKAAVQLWALKESYLKASGETTHAVFETAFDLWPDGTIVGPAGWSFQLFDEIEGYCLALAERTKPD